MGLRTENRLRRRSDFVRTYEQGRQIRGGFFTLFVLARGDDQPVRFGFTLTKRVGKSVVRNRLRRQLREAARAALPQLHAGFDVVINGRIEGLGHKTPELHERLIQCLVRARMIRSQGSAPQSPAPASGDADAAQGPAR